MTRWVRSGSSQKYKKMPGNATKWGEFDNQHVKKIPPKKKINIASLTDPKQKSSSPSSNTAEIINENKFNEDNCFSFQMEKLNKMNKQKNSLEETHCEVVPLDLNSIDNINFAGNKVKNSKTMKKVKKQKTFDIKCSDIASSKHKTIKVKNDEASLNLSDHDKFSKNLKDSFSQEHSIMKTMKKKQNKNNVGSESLSLNDKTVETSSLNTFLKVKPLLNHVFSDSSNEPSNTEQNVEVTNSSDETNNPSDSFQESSEFSKKQKMEKHGKLRKYSKLSSISKKKSMNNKNSSTNSFKEEKDLHLEKHEKLGLSRLPRNVECKLFKIKKRLMKKGLPPEKQKEIITKARRKEELKHLKAFNPSKLCFNCREAGHVLANCPKKSESVKQETGICFKCGSVEHTSFKCPQKIQGFPFANCFICKVQGHISRDCPQNKHGIYPKGGSCHLCGNVNHLRWNCPTLKKKGNKEENITLDTLNENASIDAEVIIKEKAEKKTKIKGKIITF